MYKNMPTNMSTNTFINRKMFNKSAKNRPVNIQNENDFPVLGNANKNTRVDTSTDYSKVAQKEIDVDDKKEDKHIPAGYIMAKFDKNRIIIEIDSRMEERKRKIKDIETKRHDEKVQFDMINRWQKERDSLNTLLGTQSPYWDSMNLFEFDEEEFNEDYFNQDDDEDNDEEYEIEENTYYDDFY